ncbi:NADPH-dependent 7-cyano-7-deazaguanine reductase [Pelistega indica]|uniref:NADPH-dependent 7-cyano-7-deazaguanine reductase n=1 Tax=Pelistega indica TaxID=1414851 RepID=V8FTA6_9BURK|nr:MULTISPECIES: NADPH-dependent 7-cyano-7-deazaguanine reductase QueF [Pelistega]ETD66938.1 NADPH-dependent 7-cyano-7-deazaguanine reductase [Pelistega indica]
MQTVEKNLLHAPLGKSSDYPTQYDPSLLFPISRQIGRDHLSIKPYPEWYGEDVWRAFEVSWLNPKGKPEIAILRFTIPATSSHIIESKSFKLYLNSFNQEKLSWDNLYAHLVQDLSQAAGGTVNIIRENAHTLLMSDKHSPYPDSTVIAPLEAINIDNLDIECSIYEPTASLLKADTDSIRKEVLVSDLLKSNCPVTSQPDWGSVVISYEGPAIDHASLLEYIVSYRTHNGFHEQCVEQIYCDIWQQCQPTFLEVYARYTRRGGLDISPRRASSSATLDKNYPQIIRTPRQ